MSTSSTRGELELTVSSNQRLDALSPPLAQPVHHEEQQGEDEEGGDAAHDQAHSTGHGVKQAVAICSSNIEKQPVIFVQASFLLMFFCQ